MVLTIVVGGIALSQRLLNSSGGSAGDVIAVSIVAVIGISAYAPLGRSVRWVVDRAMYGMTPSYPEFVQGLQRDLASADPDSELPETLSRVLAEHLDLESAILFKHDSEEGQTEVVASVGSGTERVLDALRERRIVIPADEQEDRPAVIPFEGEDPQDAVVGGSAARGHAVPRPEERRGAVHPGRGHARDERGAVHGGCHRAP
jgi:hypothetical protein